MANTAETIRAKRDANESKYWSSFIDNLVTFSINRAEKAAEKRKTGAYVDPDLVQPCPDPSNPEAQRWKYCVREARQRLSANEGFRVTNEGPRGFHLEF